MTTPLIELQGVSRSYCQGDTTVNVLNDIHLRIEPGEMVAIIGASGSGKSTLMNILGCLDRPSSGEYRIRGRDVAQLSPDALAALRREHIGFIFQRYHLMPELSAVGNAEIPAVYANRPRQERRRRAAELLDRLGLAGKHHHRPAQLSGGQQQRVSIARALMNGGEIILADEPTGALDSSSGKDVLAILTELNRQGHTLVIVTHDMAVARHARRIIEIHDGRIVADTRTDHTPLAPPLPPGAAHPRRGRGAQLVDRVRESLHMALKAMNAHRMRTLLTMAGIVFGIAAVVTVVGLGEGAREQTLRRINFLGSNVISIYPGKDFFDEFAGSIRTLVPADAAALARQGYVDSVSPELGTSAPLRYRNKAANVDVIGVGESYFRVRGLALAEGRPFTQQQVAQATTDAIIDDNARRTLFAATGQSPLGQILLLNTMAVRVIGVMAADTNVTGYRSDRIHIWLPYTTALHRLMGQQHVNGIVVRTRADIDNAAAERAIEQLMLQRHGVKDFMLFNDGKIRRSVMKTSMTFSVLIAMVAMIALFIGSLGVMNIMLVSVTERTHEIGVRMAVGARRGDIMQQFLIEAVLVCLTGGVIGVLLALSGGALFSALAGDIFPMVTSWPAVSGAFLCACAIGMVFGYWPARNAARLNPVEALSSE
ncbi:MacB family efflux pump subunit [Candidatus Sodalis sp. SoCistrobi]|uniref:MacB family efflux pump subunit n=1 Tax=Candidatus Sodalis sp. SoCistrobi TaxID=1922216 RepID=UPI000939238A|nr:MacB family efflux pump subunit [Candidatus Sodalis sp. SoCistrobi]